MRAVIYARYSSNLQSEASIADQVEVCRRYAAERGWTVIRTYTDAAISGASRFRPAFQNLLDDAGRRVFDIVLCEAVDRLGRRLADTADLQDQLSFHGVKLFTPSIGEVTTIHVAVMGMMAQMALKDLGEKTRRGQLGRVLKGRSPGGLAYGYRVIADDDGRGGREIDPAEAEIVRRIFREFAAGVSPERIAKGLNKETILGPCNRPWSNTTLRGQADRGTGLLNNSLYRGVLEWNRCSYVKDPRTGKKTARPNPPESWEIQAVPHLRIVDDALWDAVKARQEAMRVTLTRPDTENGLNELHRARFLLSGLMRCGACGGGYTIIGKDRYGCAARRQKGTCDNARTIKRQEIESRVFDGLKERLLAPDLVGKFIQAMQDEIVALRRQRKADEAQRARKRGEVDRKIAGMMRAIEDGLYEPSMKERLKALQNERLALEVDVGEAAGMNLAILSHPNLPELYRRKVEQIEKILDGPNRAEAMDLIRSMIDRVELRPHEGGQGLDAILHGDLAAILSACAGVAEKEDAPDRLIAGRRLSVVAGARNHLYRTRSTSTRAS